MPAIIIDGNNSNANELERDKYTIVKDNSIKNNVPKTRGLDNQISSGLTTDMINIKRKGRNYSREKIFRIKMIPYLDFKNMLVTKEE